MAVDAEQPAGLLDHRVLARRQVVGEVVRTRRRLETGDHPAAMSRHAPAEHLSRQVDPVRTAFGRRVERAAAGAVDPGRRNTRCRARARRDPPRCGPSGGRRPRPRFRRPTRRRRRRRPRSRTGSPASPAAARRHSGRARGRPPSLGGTRTTVARPWSRRGPDALSSSKASLASPPVAETVPPARFRRRADALRRVAEAEDEQMRHARVLRVGRTSEST
jgi:hypothetical protein